MRRRYLFSKYQFKKYYGKWVAFSNFNSRRIISSGLNFGRVFQKAKKICKDKDPIMVYCA